MRAATLAVGTEVTDGQILDANSAWLSRFLANAGLEVIEHRAVPDDRELILKALAELSDAAELLFVTGGLGPTSDDFTRDVIAQFLECSLELDEKSWAQIEAKLTARGVKTTESQRRQAYFPKGARVLENKYGTANGFTCQVLSKNSGAKKNCFIYALPGPPIEIESIFQDHLAGEILALIPEAKRERLQIWRCLGKAESDLADLVESILDQKTFRIGYRAHSPYVEIKVWTKSGSDQGLVDTKLAAMEAAISPWLINRDSEDVFLQLIAELNSSNAELLIYDAATKGQLEKRLGEACAGGQSAIRILTDHTLPSSDDLDGSGKAELDIQADIEANSGGEKIGLLACLTVADNNQEWHLRLRVSVGEPSSLKSRQAWSTKTVRPAFAFPLRSDRGRKFITEKVALLLTELKSTWLNGKLLPDTTRAEQPHFGIDEAIPKAKFPHPGVFRFQDYDVEYQEVIRALGEDISPERLKKIEDVVMGRTCNVVTVLEDIYDRGNASAVMRSSEAMGFQVVHLIEPGENFKSSNRVSSGADKWLDVIRWRSTGPCVAHLKSQGYQIVATHLDSRAKPLAEIDLTKPTAFVLGNEKDGISADMIKAADLTAIIPMSGFVQSFNISVAGALGLFEIRSQREKALGKSGDLSEKEKQILKAVFLLRSTKNAGQRLQRLHERKLSR